LFATFKGLSGIHCFQFEIGQSEWQVIYGPSARKWFTCFAVKLSYFDKPVQPNSY
jgi:hypothetical protein